MRIRVVRHFATKIYAHYPGQVLVDAPYERELLDAGAAVPEKATPETAVTPQTESAVIPQPMNITRRK